MEGLKRLDSAKADARKALTTKSTPAGTSTLIDTSVLPERQGPNRKDPGKADAKKTPTTKFNPAGKSTTAKSTATSKTTTPKSTAKKALASKSTVTTKSPKDESTTASKAATAKSTTIPKTSTAKVSATSKPVEAKPTTAKDLKQNTRSHGRHTGIRVPIGSAGLDTTESARNKKRKISLTDGESDVESVELAASTTSHLSKVPEELLEMILFELPMLDLFVVQSVSKRVRNSIETLHTSIYPDFTTGPAIPVGHQLVKPAQLNPLLRRDTRMLETLYLGGPSAEWMTPLEWHGKTFDCMSKLPGTWRNMHVTDISCTRAIVATLHSWRHKRESRRSAVGTPARPVTNVNTLTLGMLMDGLFNTKTWVSLRLPAETQTRTYGTLADVLAAMRAKHPGTFKFDLTGSKIFLAGVVAPTQGFWQMVWDEAIEADAAQAEADASAD
ncbi:hypothetical protein B0A48_03720 [Cryoendolithus antarcticus]|uniref:F-box domain-containing protein n=1 Tax=Cryoendolithus antarcticus TaxID=1507870 RepID=A0A1V8TGL9_9PEZI|nr:hypothetical protein B0A48_03720 [Cryoendolithus antarcticus]